MIEVQEHPPISRLKAKRMIREFNARHPETLGDLGDAAGIFSAIKWCVCYGAVLTFVAWGATRLWGML